VVYLVRGSVLSLSFVEPHTRDRPKRLDEQTPRHAPRNGCWHHFISPKILRFHHKRAALIQKYEAISLRVARLSVSDMLLPTGSVEASLNVSAKIGG